MFSDSLRWCIHTLLTLESIQYLSPPRSKKGLLTPSLRQNISFIVIPLATPIIVYDNFMVSIISQLILCLCIVGNILPFHFIQEQLQGGTMQVSHVISSDDLAKWILQA